MKDSELAREYSTKYFKLLEKVFSFHCCLELAKNEEDPKRASIQTHEYWWIKYKMLKEYKKIDDKKKEESAINYNYTGFVVNMPSGSPIDSESIENLKRFREHLNDVVDKTLYIYNSSHTNLDEDKLKKIKNSVLFRRGDKVIDDESLKKLVLQDISELFDYYLQEWHIDNILVSDIEEYLSSCKMNFREQDNEIQTQIKQYVVDNYKIKNEYKKIFNLYYKSNVVKIEFEDAFSKYGAALFDFFSYHPISIDTLSNIKSDNVCPYDREDINRAAGIIIAYFLNDLFDSIANYEEIFKTKIVIDRESYRSYVHDKIVQYIFKNDKKAFDEDWWLEGLGKQWTSSKIAFVPSSVFEEYVNKVKEI